MAMSRELFGQLSSEYKETLLRSAYKRMRCKEDAEDVVQSTLLKGFRFRHAFRYDSSFGAWLYKIMLNEVGMFFRARKCGRWNVNMETSIDSDAARELCSDYSLRPDVLFMNKAIRVKFEKALEEMPSAQKDVALLRFGLGMTMKEMAVALDRTELGVKASLYRARAFLKREMVEAA